MRDNINERKNKKSRFHFRPILSLLIGLTFFTLILFIALGEVGKSTNTYPRQNSNGQRNQKDKDGATGHKTVDESTTAIVLEVDRKSNIVRLFDITQNEELRLNFTGGSNILDKYGQVISISQVEIGLIVDVDYQGENHKLSSLKYSDKAWEYIGVNNMTIQADDKVIKIAKSNYTYEDPYVMDKDGFIALEDLAIQDELTVRGIDETIWSIVVTKGHGTVRIKDYEAFLGGNITVGYEAVLEITKDLVITAREGNYNLTVENDRYSGTKNITVERNAETLVSVGDLGPEPVKHGKIIFEINPFGADLFIDNELRSYASPIDLSYGEHSLEVSLGGYSTYRGNFTVDLASKKIQVALPELESRDPVSIVETQSPEEASDNWQDQVEYNDWDSEHNGDDEDSIVDSGSLIFIQNPSGASVYLNGEYKGVSPGSFQKVIGSHVLTFIKQGNQTKSYTIDIADDGLDTYISLPDLAPSR